MRPNRTTITTALLAVAILVTAQGCASSSKPSTVPPKNPSPTTTTVGSPAPTTVTTTDRPILIVLTDDDGIQAPGIDELARQLMKLDGVTVKVVAPATDQSGKGDSTTQGKVAYHDAHTASGIAGVAVEGTPADSVNVALDDLGLKPDLIASGINKGQNVGPIAKVSGTVGAALTGVRRGIPGIAGSAGITDPDYAPAAKYVVDWVVTNRSRISAGTLQKNVVVNINIPGCTSGSIHGLVDVPTAKEIPQGVNPFATDCAATSGKTTPTDDVDALVQGFAARSLVPTS